MLSGEKFEQMETFGQFPLQVTSARNIHESLEATTSQGEIETVNTDPSGVLRSGQEVRERFRHPSVSVLAICLVAMPDHDRLPMHRGFGIYI